MADVFGCAGMDNKVNLNTKSEPWWGDKEF